MHGPFRQRTFAFYHDIIATLHHDVTTVAGRAPDGSYVVANWIGPSVDGKPGAYRQGGLVRPKGWRDYRLLGEVHDKAFQFAFPDRLRALPDSVFEADAMYTQHAFFSLKAHEIDEGAHTLMGMDASGRPVRANWFGTRLGGLPDDNRPGERNAGHLLRPEHFESYEYVGRVDPDDLSFEFAGGELETTLDLPDYYLLGGRPTAEAVGLKRSRRARDPGPPKAPAP